MTTASLRAVPDRVEIDGREFTLDASLWRDFMPVAPPDGEPLTAILKVSPSDMMPLPGDFAIDWVWVLNGDEQWSAAADRPGHEPVGSRLEQSVRGGPKWGPGIKVDVVVRLKQGDRTWLVRVADREVKRTD